MTSLPAYELQLSAFHRAFEPELRAALQTLPLAPAMRVLDLACGDGFYTRRLAELLGAGGSVTGVDVDPSYLEVARAEIATYRGPAAIELVQASFDALPFAPASFDFIWCAQSLQSLPDPILVLRHLAPIVRPGGMIAILENDTMHQVFLPWPIALELPLRTAELRALVAQSSNPAKYYVGRRLAATFASAGLAPVRTSTIAIDRQAPFTDTEHQLLQGHLDELLERVTPFLEPELLPQLQVLVDRGSPQHLLRRPHLTMSWLNILATARRPD